MHLSRRALALLGVWFGCLALPEAAQAQVNCAGVPAWNATTTYQPGNRVVYQGSLYESRITAANIPPNYCPGCGWWTNLGVCGTGGGDTTAPSVPGGLSSPSQTTTSIALSWNASTDNAGGSGVAGYEVLRNGAQVGAPGGTSFMDSGLTANTLYSYTVRSRDNAGNRSGLSGAISVRTQTGGGTCSALPSVPGNLRSTGQTSSSITMAWNASTNTGGSACSVQYRLFRGTALATQTTGLSFTNGGLAASTSYTFRVAAMNQFGQSAQSGPVTVTTTGTGGGNPCPTCTHKRLKIINGCGQPIWIQYLNGNGGGTLSAPNRHRLGSLNSFIEYDIPDKGIAGVRFWPGMGCDAGGHNCTIGASGGPPAFGFTCPAVGCSPPVDSKFEATFGCINGIASGSCQGNPSGGGAPLGRLDWWNSSAVDGYTLPFRVRVIGNCPVGPQPEGPGGPPGGVTSCTSLRFSDCPTNENLSSNGQFANLSSVNLILRHPSTNAVAGCFSPSGKMTFSQWNAGFQTYPPQDPHAMWYACPTPPITPQQCSAGPADSTAYRNVIHARCQNTYAYPYDDTFGLATCPAATNLQYEVTFFCPQ
jgi:chitodextrinase